MTLALAAAGALGVGSFAGSIISTYGGKGRDRREARSTALDGLEKLEIARRTRLPAQGSYYDRQKFTELCAMCMIAGVPRYIVNVYDHFCEVDSRFTAVDEPGSWHVSYQAVMASIWLADEAAQLIRDVMWRLQLTSATRWWRAWRLRRKAHRLYGDYWPSTLPGNTYRLWLKEDNTAKKAHRAQA